MTNVAVRMLLTNGVAMSINAKRTLEYVHVVKREGLCLLVVAITRRGLSGSFDVDGELSSGDSTKNGRRNDPSSIMVEKMISDVLPTRPISANASSETCPLFRACCRK